MLDSGLMHDGAASGGNRTGLLLLNLGTPNSPRPEDVRPYLDEFLSDPRVLDMPAWRQWLVLHLFILPFRPKTSGEGELLLGELRPVETSRVSNRELLLLGQRLR